VKVKRIVSNVATSDLDEAGAFYEDILGLEVLSWTLAGSEPTGHAQR
jgi:catechol 2,3-dioxygenase-like lactoylglutathione lyase family enzyme